MAKPKVKVKDKGWDAIVSTAKKYAGLKGKAAVVGIQASGSQRSGEEGGLTNVLIGTVHEFGSPSKNIPERSFLRATFDAKSKGYEKELERISEMGASGKDIDGEMLILAEQFRADIIERFDSNIPPPAKRQLAEAQSKKERARANDPTLHDTGQLRDSISASVVSMAQAEGKK